jgi:isopentenyl-diphosphate delta-isomerase
MPINNSINNHTNNALNSTLNNTSGIENENLSLIQDRKIQHIQIVKDSPVQPFGNGSIWQKYRLSYKALPEKDLAKINTEYEFLGKKLSFPFLISSMTGGAQKAETINKNLAIAAENQKVAVALGSMRVTLKQPESLESFQVRHLCPSVPLLANLGLVQLNYGFGAKEINQIIDSVEADGICMHINPLQEAVQPEGDVNFEGLIDKLCEILGDIKKPVIVKEVGTGLDLRTAVKLAKAGVRYMDVSGSGGVSWVAVEGFRRDDGLGKILQYEGVPTDLAIIQLSLAKLGYNVEKGDFEEDFDPTEEDMYKINYYLKLYNLATMYSGSGFIGTQGQTSGQIFLQNLNEELFSFDSDEIQALKQVEIIAGGGLRSGLDVYKSELLGANMGTAAKPFLEPALTSPESVIKELQMWRKEYAIAKFVG